MITSHSRGHEIYFSEDNKQWLYVDNDMPVDETRACKHCGKLPIYIAGVGYADACTGHIPGASSVCCGYGIEEKMISKNSQNNGK